MNFQGLSQVGNVVVSSESLSPVIHLRLTNPPKDRLENETILQNIVDEVYSMQFLYK